MSLNEHPKKTDTRNSADIAIVGMGCHYAGAPDLKTFWHNILTKTDSISDPPPEAWSSDTYYDPDSDQDDRVYCKRGGYIGGTATFDPIKYGIMPTAVHGGEPDQWIALHTAYEALVDAGYDAEKIPEANRTAVILGKGTYLNRGNLGMVQRGLVVDQTLHVIRSLHPEFTAEEIEIIRKELRQGLPPYNSETAQGLVPNVIAGRIANRFNLKGPAFTVDAACASALFAMEIAIRDLKAGKIDLAITGGAQISTPVPILGLFCKIGALSRKQMIRPFDEDADGTVLGEGVGIIVVKRWEDAVKDGNRIYAVIRGIGSSSDGRGLSVLAPQVEGEVTALNRAFENAGISPRSIGLIEAHGTGTPAGDVAEIEALKTVFGTKDASFRKCAIGSVKSMISHTMPAAGAAGIIKAALSIYHKVLPPTLNVEKPNPKLQLEESPFYINTETRPWIHGAAEAPRRAGVNSFGFGGANAHILLEEDEIVATSENLSLASNWDTEVFVISAPTRADLIDRSEQLCGNLAKTTVNPLDLAYSLNRDLGENDKRLAIVASGIDDLGKKLEKAVSRLKAPDCTHIKYGKGIYFFDTPLSPKGKIGFLFPGEGAQYVNMLADLCIHFPEARQCFDRSDRFFHDHERGYVPSDYIYPIPAFSATERKAAEDRIWKMDGAIEAVLTANDALFNLLCGLGIRPDAVLGHSTGEYSALRVSGILDIVGDTEGGHRARELNRAYEELAQANQIPRARLLAVGADVETVQKVMQDVDYSIYIGMENCPHQTVIVGEDRYIDDITQRFSAMGLICQRLPFDRPYHTPLFTPYAEKLHDYYSRWITSGATIPVYSCVSKDLFPDGIDEIRTLASQQWIKPVRFRETIEKMHDDGIRIFIEVGPRGNLCTFIDDILKGREFISAATNVQRHSGLTQLNHFTAIMAAHRVPVDFEFLYKRRSPQALNLSEISHEPEKRPGLQKLATGWPEMTLSPKTAQSLVGKKIAGTSGIMDTLAPVESKDESAPSPFPTIPQPNEQMDLWQDETASEDDSVIESFLATMDHFLDVQRETMAAFLSSASDGDPGSGFDDVSQEIPTDMDLSSGPTGQVESMQPFFNPAFTDMETKGDRLIIRRHISLKTDPFLKDHVLGRASSFNDQTKPVLAVVPLTMSMEILAEAGSLLFPGSLLVEMKDFVANRWLALDVSDLSLKIVARKEKTDSKSAIVEIFDITKNKVDVDKPVVKGTVVFAEAYPIAPTQSSSSLREKRQSKWRKEDLYKTGMFHGPMWQGVSSIDHWGEDGCEATLAVLPKKGYFRPDHEDEMITDPVVLDAAGQLVGFWTMETLSTGFVVFPYCFRSLQIFGPNRPVGSQVNCHARIKVKNAQQVVSSFTIVSEGKETWMRIEDWEDKRFNLPMTAYQFLLSPETNMASKARCFNHNHGAPSADLWFTYTTSLFNDDTSFWLSVFSYAVLSERERDHFQRLNCSEREKSRWLIGKLVAKDALRNHLKQKFDVLVGPAEIEWLDEKMRLLTSHPALEGEPNRKISIATQACDEFFGAIANTHGEMAPLIALDITNLKRDMTPTGGNGLSRQEQELLSSLNGSASRAEWHDRLLSAKRVVSKAISGSPSDTDQTQALFFDASSGKITIGLSETPKHDFVCQQPVEVNTHVEGEHIISVFYLERTTHDRH